MTTQLGGPEQAAARLLATDPERGLTSAEARARLAQFGPNELVPERRERWWQPLLHALTDPMVLLLLAAGTVYLLLGDRLDAAILYAALVPIVAMDLALELRAERTLGRLRALAAPRAEVLRDGQRTLVPTNELVPGDVLFVREGDVVPADGVLLDATGLQADESALTGESEPAAKRAWQGEGDPTSGPRDERVFAGTVVLTGRGKAIVAATGPRTEFGRIGQLVAAAEAGPTPLQRAIGRLVRAFGVLALVVCVAVVGIELLRGVGWSGAILAGVSLAMATIPEEFPVVFTLYLSLGVWRMARHNALVRRLAGVEVLGSTSVICADKTGTLTEGRMAVRAVATPERVSSLDGATDPAVQALLSAAMLASDPEPVDPLERAIAAAAEANGLSREAVYAGRTLVHVYGFDPAEKLVAHVWRDASGRLTLYAKGAIEQIVARSASAPAVADALAAANQTLAGRGLRVLAVARRDQPELTGERARDLAGLELVGLVGFADPPRPEVPAAVAECQQAGIRVIMLTGDHPLTAVAIAGEVGIGGADPVVADGQTVESADEASLASLVRRVDVFARILPAQKYRIVRALKATGAVVAMTGDGINDAPALRTADVGVAMGRRGTEVARSAATMVLLDDNFATIVAAVREGRRIFTNLRQAFAYLVAFHVPIVLGALLVPLTGAPLLLLPIHLVWLELIVHPTASLVFQAEALDPALMRRPPRRPDEGLLPPRSALRVGLEGLGPTAVTLGLYLTWLADGAGEGRARALALAALITAQLLLVLVERAPEQPFWQTLGRDNRWLPLILGGSLASLVVVLLAPPLHPVFKFAPLAPADLLPLAGGLLLVLAWAEGLKALFARLR